MKKLPASPKKMDQIPKDVLSIWALASSELAGQLTSHDRKTWLDALKALTPNEVHYGLNLEPNIKLYLLAPNGFFTTNFRRKFGARLTEVLLGAGLAPDQWDLITPPEIISRQHSNFLNKEQQEKAAGSLAALLNVPLMGSAIPNVIAKSLLFAPTNRGATRPHYKDWRDVPLIHVNQSLYSLAFRHDQLDQNDLTAYLILIRLAHENPTFVASFSGYELLQQMRKKRSEYSWLRECLDRMTSTIIRVATTDEAGKPKFYQEALAPRLLGFEGDKKYHLALSPTMFHLLGFDHFSYIDLDSRFKLGTSQQALALQTYLSATQSPHYFKVMDIFRLWGQNYNSGLASFMADFRRRCIKPLLDIGFLTHVEENPSRKITLASKSIGFYFKSPSAPTSPKLLSK